MWKRIKKGEMQPAPTLFDDVARLSEVVELVPKASFVARAMALAVRLDHAIYDRVYLAMTEATGTPLVTADARFLRKLDAAGLGGRAPPVLTHHSECTTSTRPLG